MTYLLIIFNTFQRNMVNIFSAEKQCILIIIMLQEISNFKHFIPGFLFELDES